ncbi:MAG: acyl-CoA carboxylase subunit beta [Candidatus Dormibacteraeota bacterium]|uniref:Acyl-CoA carboxylase subunit beta n=1 Tax=Candidatus Amunia macphersoniae TaxID=3127014 RepID=A0A934NG34_9BACT|nr:acyl-CoA carboxylase subunit beta [Candidatus Dormibacteraeota bacterium]
MAGERSLDDLAADLEVRRTRARAMGGEEAIAKQHGRNKLTARERIDLLFDPGTFVESGALAHQHSLHVTKTDPDRTPADGVVTGDGLIEGRRVYCAAYDFTVMAGSMGMIGEQKVARLRAKALLNRLPMVWLLDSAGARIQEAAGSTFAGSGALFYEQVQMSGVVPMVAAMLGPCAAGTAYIPGLADFVPMVADTSSMSLGGARLVRAATGEETTDHDMGGSQVHCYVSGVGDVEVADDAACIATVREFLGFLPSHNREPAPRRPSEDSRDRRIDDFGKLVPTSARAAYDMRKVIRRLTDDGQVFEIKPTFAKNIITALVRFDGRSCGVVASQPMNKGGALDNDAADKAARFITLCDAFNIPLLFLQDVPGFIVGTEVEKQGIIRHGAKMLYAVSEATVAKITVVLRKAYGAGYYVMCGRGYQPDTIVAWPGAEISVMGPEGAVDIIFTKQMAAADDPVAERAKLVETVRQTIDPYVAASWAMVDDIIDPADTRRVICDALDAADTKHQERPWRKHGIPPV